MCTPLNLPVPGSGLERSNSKLKNDFLRFVGHHTKPNKPACSAQPSSSMPSTLQSTRSFLSKTGRMGSLHRKQRSGDSATSMQPEHAAPLNTESIDIKLPVELIAVDVTTRTASEPLHSSELEAAVSDRERSDDADSVVELPAKMSESFTGLPELGNASSSHQDLIDRDFLQKAFGITVEEGHTAEEPENTSVVNTADPITPPESEDEFEMDIPIQLAKDKRPDLQVSIPNRTSNSTSDSSTASRLSESSRGIQGTPNTISPPSTAATTRSNKHFNGLATARLSIVSPLSVVEMPKPRRPFSALSLEGMTTDKPPNAVPATKSATSNSSEDTSEQDGKSSNFRHSPHSSLSSVNSNATSKSNQQDHKTATATAVVLERVITIPQRPKNVRSETAPSSMPMRPLKDKQSVASIKSTMSPVNKNKPLPPEPGQIDIRPLNLRESPSRSSTILARHRTQSSQGWNDSPVRALNVSRPSSRTSTSLRSKYTPKDLDALDDAFMTRTIPSQNQIALSYSSTSTPSLSQVTLALESQLGTIREDHSSTHSVKPSDPLQISRGPMRMEPSRRAPAPPGQPASPAPEKHESPRKRFMKRSASSNHVISQMRSVDDVPKRASTAAMGSSSKANRILGKNGYGLPPRMQRQASKESNWSYNASPQMYTAASSPTESGEDEDQSYEDEPHIPDAQFEEIRKRLELLSPKEEQAAMFPNFHSRHASHLEKVVVLRRSQIETIQEPYRPPSIKPIASSQTSSDKMDEISQPEIAELECPRSPSPVELEDTQRPFPVELADPRSEPSTAPAVPPVQLETIEEDEVQPPEPEPVPQTKDPIPAARPAETRSLHSQRSIKCRSLASLAASEIPDLYAAIPTPETKSLKSQRPSMTPEEVEQLISADAAERVLLRILESLENLEDLFAAATVSRGFYRTFKRHELHLIKNALWCMSPAAWELREMSVPFAELPNGAADYKPTMYLRHYTRDLLTMVKLKGMILDHCKSFLRVETISGLAGETDRSPFIDDAFWRVWTFCKIFGCGKGREDDIVGQMDWLRGGVLAKQQSTDTNTLALNDGIAMNSVLFNPPTGFAKGNSKGLTAEELYDMTEIWTCLGVLVRGYHGKRDQARKYGIFDGTNIAFGDVAKENATIEEWTSRILTLAPATILAVAAPTTPTATTFDHAKSQGYTQWDLPTNGLSRSTFLKEAVHRVYEERMSLYPRPSLSSASSFSTLPQVVPPSPEPGMGSPAPPRSPDTTLAARQRYAAHRAEIRAKRQDPSYKDVPVSEERPMSNYPEVLARLDALSRSEDAAPSVPKVPSLASRFSLRRPKVTITSPSSKSSKVKGSPLTSATSSPTASPRKSGRASNSSERLPLSSSARSSREALPIAHPGNLVPGSIGGGPIMVPTGPQVRDPVDVAVEKLVGMGFEEKQAKKALAETDTGNAVNFEKAMEILIKGRERKKVMSRLNRMG